MTIALTQNAIVLDGPCGVEDVDMLLGLIETHPELPVDLASAGEVHTALWQVLLMTDVPLSGAPPIPFYRDHLMPALRSTEAIEFPDHANL